MGYVKVKQAIANLVFIAESGSRILIPKGAFNIVRLRVSKLVDEDVSKINVLNAKGY